jgi:ribonuclease P protein component
MRDACENCVSGSASQRLERASRIGRRGDFLLVYQRGQKIHSQNFVLYLMPNHLLCHRIGLTVSKKIGGAVLRNKVRRRLREIFRRNRPTWGPGLDFVINAKKSIGEAEFGQLVDEWVRCVRKVERAVRATP